MKHDLMWKKKSFDMDKVCALTRLYTTLTNFSTKYLVICKVYTDVGGINTILHVLRENTMI